MLTNLPLVGAFSVIVKTDCETDGSFYSTSQQQQSGTAEMCFAEWSPDTEQERRVYQSPLYLLYPLYPLLYGVYRVTALNETPLPLHTAPTTTWGDTTHS